MSSRPLADSPDSPASPSVSRDAGAPILPPPPSLPPVEPPDAGFLVQLFVIPLLIVAAVFGAGMLVSRLARRHVADPQAIVASLRSSGPTRFQAAKDVADMLRLPQQYPGLIADRSLATELGRLLDQQREEAPQDDDAAETMRIILCRALGDFHTPEGLPALIGAALHDPDRDVRRHAVNAIAVLAGSLSNLSPPQSPPTDDLFAALSKLAEDQDPLIRSETAFAIGAVAAGPVADSQPWRDALATLADDPYTDARFNAALALGRLGDTAAVTGLTEMLDPETLAASVRGEKAMTADVTERALVAQQSFKRNLILHNCLRSVDRLAEAGQLAAADRERLTAAIDSFLSQAATIDDPSPVPDELLDAAANARQRLAAQ